METLGWIVVIELQIVVIFLLLNYKKLNKKIILLTEEVDDALEFAGMMNDVLIDHQKRLNTGCNGCKCKEKKA